jgi:hypothetical protein
VPVLHRASSVSYFANHHCFRFTVETFVTDFLAVHLSLWHVTHAPSISALHLRDPPPPVCSSLATAPNPCVPRPRAFLPDFFLARARKAGITALHGNVFSSTATAVPTSSQRLLIPHPSVISLSICSNLQPAGWIPHLRN